jgi:hypothetical protein
VSYWLSPWAGEDGGPRRNATTDRPFPLDGLEATFREAVATTMVVLREPGEVFSLHHTAGADAISWVERIDPITLETVVRSPDLPGGPTWPGGLAAHANGSLYVAFGAHAHRLDADCNLVASRRLPRTKPYNSFVILPDGCIATKDFGGVLPGQDPSTHVEEPCELVVLEPQDLQIVARVELPEASIARLSADDATIYVVGTSTLSRAHWDGTTVALDESFSGVYRNIEGQTYGWDCVIALGAAWFLDNGYGSERYVGTFLGQGVNEAPLHLVRVDLETGAVTLTEICGLPNGVVANPPLIDETRRIAVGYDSGNGVLAAFDIGEDATLTPRWQRLQNHACHPLLFADSGLLFTTDYRVGDDVVLLDIETGLERARVASGSAVQSVLFPAPGWNDDFYYCSFAGIARVFVQDHAL